MASPPTSKILTPSPRPSSIKLFRKSAVSYTASEMSASSAMSFSTSLSHQLEMTQAISITFGFTHKESYVRFVFSHPSDFPHD